ncbi:extracellular catalytic domain type 1 short-chain-length polyhydroxyalkanoate depolymerase [Allostreptomyces psammosilenae]|uniref:Poly(Hydroxyalkanoate) depolymerase family esterase n=1 Tax=Allostreptomyces psammosilenae TaxID=1892865 RepID=A0A852ZVQ7_9ACTN|nr:PHB depolymerase family esterase [Allostreptomyces psammosilenae]NYI04864.1 poly(hydroxyalkanoate) depolymerase family esterase [Allostreptomyces psammosilenae]
MPAPSPLPTPLPRFRRPSPGAPPAPRRRPRALGALATLLLTLGALLAPAPTAHAASIQEVTGFGSNPGALRMFRYVPDGLPPGRPLVVAMHGCTQNASGYGTGSGWTRLADRWGFAVLLPQQTAANNLTSCFNWFLTGDNSRGSGEALSIRQMVERMVVDLGTDRSRIHVTGLSAGGAMTAVMMATYPEVFAAGGVVAGLPYRCAQTAGTPYLCMYGSVPRTADHWGDLVRAASPHTGPWPRLTVLHGTADYTVVPANMTELVAQWTNVHGTDATADVSDTVAGYPHRVYHDTAGRPAVETYSLTGMGHGQPVDPGTGTTQCGTTGAYILDVNLCAAYHLGHTWGLG